MPVFDSMDDFINSFKVLEVCNFLLACTCMIFSYGDHSSKTSCTSFAYNHQWSVQLACLATVVIKLGWIQCISDAQALDLTLSQLFIITDS